MESEANAKIVQLLDLISAEVAANRNETSELRGEMRAGFGRVERRSAVSLWHGRALISLLVWAGLSRMSG